MNASPTLTRCRWNDTYDWPTRQWLRSAAFMLIRSTAVTSRDLWRRTVGYHRRLVSSSVIITWDCFLIKVGLFNPSKMQQPAVI